MHDEARLWIDKLQLSPHPEGGFFRESYRAGLQVLWERRNGSQSRSASTAIYYLLDGDHASAFHRIPCDEVWHFYAGSTVRLHLLSAGVPGAQLLGNSPEAAVEPQRVVPSDTWFAAEVTDAASYALVGCTVAPGFEFEDFQLADAGVLVQRYPQHKALIERLTPGN